ncbi:ROK family protein [Methanochimaera problematica]|nr:ROK family protein [Methanoplanus sp. FWC-SCC4]
MYDEKNIIAVDLGATNLRVALFGGRKLKKIIKSKTPDTGNIGIVVTDRIIDLIYELIRPKEVQKILSIGVSSAGPLDISKGLVVNSPNMKYEYIDIVQPLKDEFQKDVYLINDCRAGVLGEIYAGSGQKCENLVYITISTGIGGGAYANGNLILGRDGNAGEIGHFCVDTSYNLPCLCKGKGHWEAYSSGANIPRFFRAFCNQKGYPFDEEKCQSAENIFGNAKQGEKEYVLFLDELGKINARGISNVVLAYSPEKIILDGSVALSNRDEILTGIKKHYDSYLKMPKIEFSSLNGLSPLYGAAYYSFQKVCIKDESI